MAQTGRPRKFETVEELQKQIDAYFKLCEDKGKPYTITGLALSLDTFRKVLLDYENEYDFQGVSAKLKKQFSNAIKKAKAKVLEYNEELLYRDKQVAGVIFNLKNNFGYVDKHEIDQKITGNLSLTQLSKSKND